MRMPGASRLFCAGGDNPHHRNTRMKTRQMMMCVRKRRRKRIQRVPPRVSAPAHAPSACSIRTNRRRVRVRVMLRFSILRLPSREAHMLLLVWLWLRVGSPKGRQPPVPLRSSLRMRLCRSMVTGPRRIHRRHPDDECGAEKGIVAVWWRRRVASRGGRRCCCRRCWRGCCWRNAGSVSTTPTTATTCEYAAAVDPSDDEAGCVVGRGSSGPPRRETGASASRRAKGGGGRGGGNSGAGVPLGLVLQHAS